jgi:flagellar hook assembly protein FlgD
MLWTRGLISVFIALLFSTFVATPKPAQTQAVGYLEGEVVDPRGAVVSRVPIAIESKTFKLQVLTDGEGKYRVELPAGTYRVTAEASSFRRFRQKKVVIDPKVTTKLNINLKFGHPIIEDERHP